MRRAALPAQAQVAAWVSAADTRASERVELGRATVRVPAQDQFFLFYFQLLLISGKMKNSLKKIGKVIFLCG